MSHHRHCLALSHHVCHRLIMTALYCSMSPPQTSPMAISIRAMDFKGIQAVQGFETDPFSRSRTLWTLSKLGAVPFPLQNRAIFDGEKKAREDAERRGGRGVASQGGKKEKRMRANRSGKEGYFMVGLGNQGSRGVAQMVSPTNCNAMRHLRHLPQGLLSSLG